MGQILKLYGAEGKFLADIKRFYELSSAGVRVAGMGISCFRMNFGLR